MQIFDAHLDLAYNVALGRDVTKPAREQAAADAEKYPWTATVGLPDLRAGGVDFLCATIYCEPKSATRPGYTTADEARAQAIAQLDWYRAQFQAGEMALATGRGACVSPAQAKSIQTILLLEGADPIRTPADVQFFYDAGVRIVGLAWKKTRYAGGTGEPGPISLDGRALLAELDRFGMVHDASHLAEQSFWQLLDLSAGPIIASHSNCRAIAYGSSNRQLTDDMIRAIIARGGVIGINFFDRFLLPAHDYGKRRATLADVVAHVRHICDLAGNANHVGLGTDMDGGLGRDEIPIEIQTSADLPRVAEALSNAKLADADVEKIMSENWKQFFTKHLSSWPGRETRGINHPEP